MPPLENHYLGPWIIAAPVLGALLIGLMALYGSEKIPGHGIPEALEAILLGRSMVERKVALLKPISSAISIGTGGPFGAGDQSAARRLDEQMRISLRQTNGCDERSAMQPNLRVACNHGMDGFVAIPQQTQLRDFDLASAAEFEEHAG